MKFSFHSDIPVSVIVLETFHGSTGPKVDRHVAAALSLAKPHDLL